MESRKTPWKLITLSTAIAFCSNWQFGYQITYVNTAVWTFHSLFNASYAADNNGESMPYETWTLQWGLAVASIYVGTFFGVLFVPASAKRLGIKCCFLLSCIPAGIGCILNLFAHGISENSIYGSEDFIFLDFLIIGRILIGCHAGAAMALMPLWVQECSPHEYRGVLSAFQQVAVALTSLLGLIIGSPMVISPNFQWRFEIFQVIAIIPTLVLFIVILICPQSPYFYHEHPSWTTNKEFDASIKFYYGSDTDIKKAKAAFKRDDSFEKSENDIPSAESDFSIKQLFVPKTTEDKLILKGFLIGTLAAFSYPFTGDDLIDSFSSQIFQDVGAESLEDIGTYNYTGDVADMVTIFLGFMLLLSSILGIWLVERLGRRLILIGGLIGTGICNILGTIFQVIGVSDPDTYSILSIAAFTMVKVFIGLGAAGPSWFLTSELVPPNARHFCQSFSTGVLLVMTGVVTAVYLPLDNAIGAYALLLLGSIPAIICAIILFFFLPETKDIANTAELFKKLDPNHKFTVVDDFYDPLVSGKTGKYYGSIPPDFENSYSTND